MKIKLSQQTPRKSERSTIISRKVSIHTRIRKITPEDIAEIYLVSDSIHVMIEETSPEIVLEIKVDLTRRKTKKEDIMLTLQRMMKLPRRELENKVKSVQATNIMF